MKEKRENKYVINNDFMTFDASFTEMNFYQNILVKIASLYRKSFNDESAYFH